MKEWNEKNDPRTLEFILSFKTIKNEIEANKLTKKSKSQRAKACFAFSNYPSKGTIKLVQYFCDQYKIRQHKVTFNY